MIDPTTGVGNVTSIQIKLKTGRRRRRGPRQAARRVPAELYGVHTWRDKQGPLLAAVQMETVDAQHAAVPDHRRGRLRHPGDLLHDRRREDARHRHPQIARRLAAAASWASSSATACRWASSAPASGMVLGLLFVRYINEIADLLERITGTPVFDPSIYYFQKIPTIVEPLTVAWIVVGAVAIAVLASILPARRAARLHPVEALRYE